MSANTLRMRWAYSLDGAKRFPVTGRKHPLERQASRHMVIAAGVAISIGLLAFVLWQWTLHRTPDEAGDRTVAIVRYTELGVPPSINRASESQVQVATQVAMAPPQIAVPEPVPDDMVNPDQTIMTVQEVNSALAAATQADLGDLSGVQIEGDFQQQTKDQEFKQSVNVLPVRLSMKRPEYPDMARMAGIEGVVTVQVLVGKDGRVSKTKVTDGPVPLHAAAVAAAMSAVFQAATTDGRPVAVWVAMPIKFTLRN
jgi:protein TonB